MAGFIKAVFGGTENPSYQVIKKTKDYEIRQYPAKKWVRTSMKHIQRDEVSSAMFWKLFNYISGKGNQSGTKIPMTAPVTIFVEPGEGPNCESTFTMAFYVPEEFQQSTPVPTEESISIEERPEMTVFTRTYGGFARGDVVENERKELLNLLEEDDRASVVEPTYYSCGYDPPFKLFGRRNEIWLVKK